MTFALQFGTTLAPLEPVWAKAMPARQAALSTRANADLLLLFRARLRSWNPVTGAARTLRARSRTRFEIAKHVW